VVAACGPWAPIPPLLAILCFRQLKALLLVPWRVVDKPPRSSSQDARVLLWGATLGMTAALSIAIHLLAGGLSQWGSWIMERKALQLA